MSDTPTLERTGQHRRLWSKLQHPYQHNWEKPENHKTRIENERIGGCLITACLVFSRSWVLKLAQAHT